MKSTKRPESSYLQNKELDSIALMQTEIMSELWILRDRVIILEHLLTKADILLPDQIDNFEPSKSLEKKLQHERDKYVARVLDVGFRQELSVEKIKAIKKSSNIHEE